MSSGSIASPSLKPPVHFLVMGVSIRPSITACATCMPLDPNSRAKDWASARVANLIEIEGQH